jgi:guanylate kinase
LLTLFVGTSGAGKTSLMEYLVEHYECELLRNFTTRPLRAGERARYNLSINEALSIAARQELQFLNSVFGNLYGVTTLDFADAVASDKIFLFDIHWSHLHKIQSSVQCIAFLIAENEPALTKRLSHANRVDRTATAFAESRDVRETYERLRSLPSVISLDSLSAEIAPTAAKAIKEIRRVLGVSL